MNSKIKNYIKVGLVSAILAGTGTYFVTEYLSRPRFAATVGDELHITNKMGKEYSLKKQHYTDEVWENY